MLEPGLLLKREVKRIGIQGTGLLFVVAAILTPTENFQTTLNFLLLSLVSWLYVLRHCSRRLSLNYEELSGKHFPQLGTGNRITLFRGLLVAATAGFLGSNQSELNTLALFLPAIFYTVAAIADALDGYIARVTKQTTKYTAGIENPATRERVAGGMARAPHDQERASTSRWGWEEQWG